MKLYISPLACSGAPHMILIELGLPHTIEFVDLTAQPHVVTNGGALYTTVNPKGAVPALMLDSGELLTEVAAILQYLGDQRPASGLLPEIGTMARYRVMEWLSFVGSDVHKTLGPLWNPEMPEAAKVIHKRNLDRRLSHIEQHLANQPYLTGQTFSVADAYLFVMMGWAPHLKFDLSPYPNLQAFHERVSARPSVDQMHRAEGLPRLVRERGDVGADDRR